MAVSNIHSQPQAARSVLSSSSTIASKESKPINPQTALARRLLFPHLLPGAELPPLFSSESLPPELHSELYDFIALALRAFVNPWWTKISRYDKELLVQINRIVTQIVHALEARVSSTDLSPLVFCDIPTILTQHYDDYRTAALKTNSSYSIGGAASLPQLFHHFQPHMAITSLGQINDDYIRQCVDFVLKAILPPEDYNPDTERYIVREIVLKIILDVIPKISQPWFLQKLALNLLGSSKDKTELKKPPETEVKHHHLSFHTMVVFVLSAIQAVSGFCLTLINGYKQALQTIKLVNALPTTERKNVSPDNVSTQAHIISSSQSSDSISRPPSSSSSSVYPSTSHLENFTVDYERDYSQRLMRLASTIFGLQNRFASAAMLNIVELMTAAASPFLDKFLPYMLYKYGFSPTRLIQVIKISKKTLFPNGYLSPRPVDPTAEEQMEIRARLVQKIGDRIPWWLSPVLLGPKTKQETIDGIIDPLSSPECNAHLLLFLLDAVLVKVIPELGSLTDVNVVQSYVRPGGKEGSRVKPEAIQIPVAKRTLSSGSESGSLY